MEHRADDARGPHLPAGGMEERQELGGPAPHVLVRLPPRMAFLPSVGPRLRYGLVWPRLVLAPDRDPRRLGLVACHLYAPLFSSVCGSTTWTGPPLRRRRAVPVGHQVRACW